MPDKQLDEVEEDQDHQSDQEITMYRGQDCKERQIQNLLLCNLQEKLVLSVRPPKDLQIDNVFRLPSIIGENIYHQVESEVYAKVLDTYQSISKEIADMIFPCSPREIT